MINVRLEANKLRIYLDHFTPQMLQAIKDEIDVQSHLLADYMKVHKLSQRSPSSVGVRTGHLRKSVHSIPATMSEKIVTGGIGVGGSGIPYARVHINNPRSTIIVAKGKQMAIPIGPAITKGKASTMAGPLSYGKKLFPIKSRKGNVLLVSKEMKSAQGISGSKGKKGKRVATGTTGKARGLNKVLELIPYFILKKSVRIQSRVDPQAVIIARREKIVEGIKRAITIASQGGKA